MNFDLIAYLITSCGLIFVIFCFILIFLGKKVGDKDTGKEKIKIGDKIELNTSSLITLTIIMICFTLAPLYLLFANPDLSKAYLSLDHLQVGIRGSVVYENKQIAEGVKIDVIREKIENDQNTKPDTTFVKAITDQNGWYDLKLDIKKGERITILWRKDNYAVSKVVYDFNDLVYSVILSKKTD